ncbi:CopG family ribbon-helix-helix protein [Enterovirga sp. CN4-39]|uniref:CopG family ribbon-helix-helix protein n=1 Tax=Enterovirga sp. CN4-39 TaxID=3400910 RepID=UPI003C096AAA
MTEHLTVKLDGATATALGEFAARYGQSIDGIVNEALTGWLDVQEGHLAAIREGLAQLDRGESVSQEEMEKLATSYSEAK